MARLKATLWKWTVDVLGYGCWSRAESVEFTKGTLMIWGFMAVATAVFFLVDCAVRSGS